jgi:dipeptidase E
MGSLLLTSAGFLNPNIFEFTKKSVGGLSLKRVAIITTAAEGKENHKYSQLAHEQLLEVGFKVADFFDLETQDVHALFEYDAFYVCGGNVFRLLKFVKSSGFKNQVISLLDRGGMYVGVSAGSLIVGPSTLIANEINPDPNEAEIKDFSSLNLTNITVFPHYEEGYESDIKNFEKRYGVKITRITNNQAVLISGENVEIIE